MGSERLKCIGNTPVMHAAFEISWGLLYTELCLPEHVASWIQNGDFSVRPLLTPMLGSVIYVYLGCLALKGENTRLSKAAVSYFVHGIIISYFIWNNEHFPCIYFVLMTHQ